jgi:hypothetical protein
MYVSRPQRSWTQRVLGSARTIAAFTLTAILAIALFAHWNEATATNAPAFILPNDASVTGIPVAIEGTVVGASDGLLALTENGSTQPVAFPVNSAASLVRDGQNVPLEALRVGDTVRMTIDGGSGQVLRLHATPAPSPFAIRVPGAVALMAALGLIAGGATLAIRNRSQLPALPQRVAVHAPQAAH